MKVEGMDVVVDEYVGRLTHEQAYELAYELLQKARQAWPYAPSQIDCKSKIDASPKATLKYASLKENYARTDRARVVSLSNVSVVS
jgi:hypothetical protein